MIAPETKVRDTVLVALDGSLAAAMALPIAFAVAAQLEAECQALHIVSDSGLVGDLSRPFAQRFEALSGITLWPEVIESIMTLWRVFAGPGNALLKVLADMKVRLEAGDPAEGILRVSVDPLVALVVLTTHGQIIEPGRSLGRVAEQVIAGARQPILLIRPEATPLAIRPGAALQRLLLPLDGTPTTAALLAPASALAGRLGAAVDLLYVAEAGASPPSEPGSIGAPQYVDQPQHEWPQWASEVSSRLGEACAKIPPSVPLRTFLARGEAGETIAHFAAEHESDAVVLARRSRLEAGRAGVLRTVLDRTPCPVLLVGD
jgi:nucleotide-binding universal stress UspA family protein